MSQNTIKILGVKITTENEDFILEKINKYFKKGKSRKAKGKSDGVKPLVIFTPNPEIVVFAQKNDSFRETVNSSQINLPDGAGIPWAIEKKYGLKIARISGVDFMFSLCRQAAEKTYRIGLIGGRSGLALATSDCLQRFYPGLEVIALGEPEIRIRNKELRIRNKNHNSEFNIHNSEEKHIESKIYFENLINTIEQRKIDILFVGLGFPKQEYFIDRIKNYELRIKSRKLRDQAFAGNNRPMVMMAVGGSFEYITGRVRRAPKWMRERGLEWAYRLIREPWRWKRQFTGSVFFPQIYFRKH